MTYKSDRATFTRYTLDNASGIITFKFYNSKSTDQKETYYNILKSF